MFNCPNCGESFAYGYPCPHELLLILLSKGKWKCARCGSVVISDCKITNLNDGEVEKIAKQVDIAAGGKT